MHDLAPRLRTLDHRAATDAVAAGLCNNGDMTFHAPWPRDSSHKTSRQWIGLLRWCGALALVAAAALVGQEWALQSNMARLREAANHRLDMLATVLDADMARFDYLPALLEMTPIVPALLETPDDAKLRNVVNRYLDGVSATAGAQMLYVLDRSGMSLAASDWEMPGTTVGHDLSFRPYVRDALEQGRGRFYGVGITSRRPGYYLSYALRRGQSTGGVVAVKVDLGEAESTWRKLPGDVVLIDERGVVILATREDLKLRPVQPLDERQLAEIRLSRPYGDASLEPLKWTQKQVLDKDTVLISLDGRDQLASLRRLKGAPWRLVVLDELAQQRTSARYAAVTASLAMAVLLLLTVTLWQRRRAMHHKLANQTALQAAHDTLEDTVVARTAQLRAAQSELVHAGKMAALGQMSAGLVHELNQPLTALRSLSDSAVILLEQDRTKDVHGNLLRITRLTDRLARLTSQLKTFAHKADQPGVPVVLAHCLADAKAMVAEAAQLHGVHIEIDVQPADQQVLADEAALCSVLVNLMRNAIEAMQSSPERTLCIRAREGGGHVKMEVRDTGTGIAPDILPHLFEPFVTSKPAGFGLGLGLVISAQLIRGMQGSLRVCDSEGDADGSGACFALELKAQRE